MSELTAVDKTKLNNFHKSQPALTYSGQMASNAALGVELGDLMDKALSVACLKVVWDFASMGGATASDIYLLGKLPANAIVTNILSNEVTNVTAAGACQMILKAGATSLATIADATAIAGVEAQTVTLTKLSAESKVYLDINTNAATAGKVEFYIQYICA